MRDTESRRSPTAVAPRDYFDIEKSHGYDSILFKRSHRVTLLVTGYDSGQAGGPSRVTGCDFMVSSSDSARAMVVHGGETWFLSPRRRAAMTRRSSSANRSGLSK